MIDKVTIGEAIKMNRDGQIEGMVNTYLGIDISNNYVEIAKKRISDYASEENKMNTEIAKHTVLKTFKERKARKNDDTTGYN
jgi:hypothetical protein